MAVADWFRPPRSVLTLYLIGAGAALLCLTWLAARQLSSETLVEAQRTRQRLAGVADVIAARVHHGLRELDESMAGEATNLPAAAVVVAATDTSVRVERGSLPFLPVAPGAQPPATNRADDFIRPETRTRRKWHGAVGAAILGRTRRRRARGNAMGP